MAKPYVGCQVNRYPKNGVQTMNDELAAMPSRPIVYLAGRAFVPGHDGQARRLQLLTRGLGDLYRESEKYILAPSPPAPAEFLGEHGWVWRPVDQAPSRSLGARFSTWWRFFRWRWLRQEQTDILAFFGGSRVVAGPATRAALAIPNAIVIVGRCEFAGLIGLRLPGQTWILDSNDSVWNLVATYGMGDRYRPLTGSSLSGWLARLRRDELAWAQRFDRIICIAKEDLGYFGPAQPGACVLEDTDILVPDNYERKAVEFDVGFVGGRHAGSRASAEALLRIARVPGLETVRFAVAGGVCSDLAAADMPPNVVLLGRVDDSLDFLSRCRCSVIIVGQETGASVKFQEALAAGCVVIANRAAARHSLAVAGETHIEVSSADEVEKIFQAAVHLRFRPRDFGAYFRYGSFCRRLAQALGQDL